MSAKGEWTLFGDLLPGDVLVHRTNEKDALLVTRVGDRLDFLQLVDGRFLESWVSAIAVIPPPYEVTRGREVLRMPLVDT